MSYELINTSAPRGLMPGSRGFTTVAMTADTPPPLIQVCDGLSNYTHVFGLESGSYAGNPPAFSHFHVRLGSRSLSVLSRVAVHAPDYSGRTNRIAHHVVLDTGGNDRLAAVGPAETLGAINFLKQWEGEPRELPPTPVPVPPGPARMPGAFLAKHWQEVFGTPDLAASLAGAWMTAPTRPTFLIVAPNNPRRARMLGLIADAIRLLPPEMRWGVTFSTYLSIDPPGGDCLCRGVLPDSAAVRLARRLPDTLIINFESGTLEGGAYGRPIANTLLPAAKGSALPPWAIPAPAQVQARTPPVARLASRGETMPVPISSELRSASTSGRPARIPNSAPHRPLKRDRTVMMIAGFICAAAVAALLVVLYILPKPQSSVPGQTETESNAPYGTTNDFSQIDAKYSGTVKPAGSPTNGAASSLAVEPATPTPTNDIPAVQTAPKSDTVEPPDPSAMEKTSVKPYVVQSSLPDAPTNGMQTKAVLSSGKEAVFTWKTPSGWGGSPKWEVGVPEGSIAHTPLQNNKTATWEFSCSMLIETPTVHLVVYEKAMPFKAIRQEWDPGVKNADEQAVVNISVLPKLQPFLKWLFDHAKTPVSLSEGLKLDKHEWLEEQHQWKLSISRAPDSSRKAREEESKQWQKCLKDVDALLLDIDTRKEVNIRKGDLQKETDEALTFLTSFAKFVTNYMAQTKQTDQPEMVWTSQAKLAEGKVAKYYESLVKFKNEEVAYISECEKAKKEKRMIKTIDFDKKRLEERQYVVQTVMENVNYGNLLRSMRNASADKIGSSGPRKWPSSFNMAFVSNDGKPVVFTVAAENDSPQ